MLSRRRLLTSVAAGAIAAPAVFGASRARAAVSLRLHHFLPPVSNPHVRFLVPWAKKVETESGGEIKIDIFPSMQLGGAPPQLYDQARDGVVDIAWTLPGNTPGRFPRIETLELPFVPDRLAVPNSLALQEFSGKYLKDEFKEVHPICFWAHDRGLVHSTRQVKTIEDMKGLKLRFPTRLAGEALKALGANAIGMPIPQVPESLANKVIEGCVIPWEVVPAVKVHELTRFHLEIPGSPTLYTTTFILAMNKAKYAGLPAAAKKALDANSGMVAAKMAGTVWDAAAIDVKAMVEKRSGNTISTLTADEAKRWRAATKPVVDGWIAQSKDKGFNGGSLLEDMQALLRKHAKAT